MPSTGHEEILHDVGGLQQQFVQCHQFLADNTRQMAELLCTAHSRGVLLHEAFELANVGYWLENIDWQTKFLSVVLAQDPSRKTLRPLIELYGRERERMAVEAEILERQLKCQLAHFAKPNDATIQKVVMKNQRRILAVYLHVRSDYGGVALSRFFKVPRSTAYGWLEWFESLPEGVQTGILEFMDTQAPVMAACQVPAVVLKAATPIEKRPGSCVARPQCLRRRKRWLKCACSAIHEASIFWVHFWRCCILQHTLSSPWFFKDSS